VLLGHRGITMGKRTFLTPCCIEGRFCHARRSASLEYPFLFAWISVVAQRFFVNLRVYAHATTEIVLVVVHALAELLGVFLCGLQDPLKRRPTLRAASLLAGAAKSAF